MKRISILVVVLMAGSLVSYAQWLGTTPVYFNAGNVGIGTSAPTADFHISRSNASPKILIENTSSASTTYPGLDINNYQGTTAGHPYLTLSNARGTKASPAAIGGTLLGTIIFSGHNSVNLVQAARMEVFAEVPFTSTSTPTIMTFSTTSPNSVSYSEKMRITSTGNVGVGTISPQKTFHVSGATDVEQWIEATSDGFASLSLKSNGKQWQWSKRPAASGDVLQLYHNNGTTWSSPFLTVQTSGNVGIGTSNPSAKLDIFGGNASTTNLILSANYVDVHRWRVKTTDRGNAIDMDFTSSDGSDVEEPVLKLSRSNSTRPEFQLYNNTIVANDGNVGIGTANPTQKLTVNGTIYSKEVKVDLSVPGPDYVFEETYNLPSLTDTETYIKQNKHLPEVPSACEMEEKGINLSEMNMILLKKVEELTLHLIDQNKLVAEQGNKIKVLEEKINSK